MKLEEAVPTDSVGNVSEKEEEKEEKSKTKEMNNNNNNLPLHKKIWEKFVAAYVFLLVPSQDWFDQDVPPPTLPRQHLSIRGDESERGSSGFTLKYGVIFEDFDRPLFGFFDLFVSTILGGTAGFAIGVLSRPKCLFLLATACVTCFAHLVYLVWRRPCLTRLMQGYMVANSVFTFLTIIIIQ